MTLRKFRLRDLFWLVLVVAHATAWWTERAARAREVVEFKQQKLLMEVELIRAKFNAPELRRTIKKLEAELVRKRNQRLQSER
jgi:hypothetical protein